EAYPWGQWRVHLISETGAGERGKKNRQAAPRCKRRPSQTTGQQRQHVAAGEASAGQSERNRRTENGDKAGYAVQVADDDGGLDRRKDPRDKKGGADDEQPPPANTFASCAQARPE